MAKYDFITLDDAYVDYVEWCRKKNTPEEDIQSKLDFGMDIAKNGGSSTGKLIRLTDGRVGFDLLYWNRR